MSMLQRRSGERLAGYGSLGLCLAASMGAPAAMATETKVETSPPVDNVVVTGTRPQLATLPAEVLNTPQDIDVVPGQILHDEGVASLQEALKNVPGITLNAGEGGSHGDDVSLRGFSASDDFFLDGLRDTGFYTRDVFNLEALEVYKGPASTLFGRGSSGGVLNQVSKSPKLSDFGTLTLAGGNADYERGMVDVNQRLGPTSAFRVNAMDVSTGVEGRDFVRYRRWGIAPSVAFGIGQPTTLVVNYLHQSEDNIPDYGIPYYNGRPAPVPHNAYYGLPSDDRTIADVDILTARLSHKISDSLSFNDSARFGNYYFDTRETAPHYASNQPFGDPVPATAPPLSQILTFRDRPSVKGVVQTWENEASLTWKTTTGPLSHTLVFGFELDREEAHLAKFANQLNTIPGTPILNPNPNGPFPGRQTTVNTRPDTVTTTVGGLILDTISYGPHWDVVLGGRVDNFHAQLDEPITNLHLRHTDEVFSPRAAIVYKPTDLSSVYLSYATSFDPSAEALSLSAKNVNLSPEQDKTYELGGKTQVLDRRLSLTASIFYTELTDARVGDPTNPTQNVLSGDERVKGVELGALGHLTRNIEVLAGYTYLDARTVASTDKLAIGKLLPNTAHNQANLFVSYEGFDADGDEEAWKVGAGVNYLGKRQADVDGLAETPGYVTFDALASYQVTPKLALKLNATNLFNKFYFTNAYFSSPTENHVLPGAGRTIIVSAVLRY